jgi:putative ABC transport system permease protein
VEIDGREWKPSQSHSATLRFITPGYFSVMGIPIRAGRDLRESDNANSLFVAVVSESFVHRYWPGQDPIDRHFRFGSEERTIVGIASDVRVSGLERSSDPQVYLPYKQVSNGAMTWFAPKDLVIQTASGLTIVPAVRRVVHDIDPELPISDVRALSEIVEQETAPRRVQVRVLGAFAAVAFFLAGIGIHGVLSVNVSRRTNEIGVRIALGATSADILIMILRESARLASTGIVLGVALGYAIGLSLQSLLAGFAPDDFAIFMSAVGLAVIMVLLGSVVPAVRAICIDPIRAMHLDA